MSIAALVFFFNTGLFAQNKNLDYYINKGLVNSPLLKDYQNQVAANAIDSQRLLEVYKTAHPRA